MSESTAGPWILATSCSWRRIVSEDGKPVCIPTIQWGDNHPDLEFPNGGADGPDARLMVAAPDLAEALDQAVTSMQDSGYSNNHIAVRAARAALAKARGEKQ